MAPNETRAVNYYIYGGDISASITSADLNDEFDTSSGFTIDDIKLASIDVKDAPDGYSYAALDDIKSDISLSDSRVVGTVTNNSGKKWEEVRVRFELSGDGCSTIDRKDAKGSYIKPGETFDVELATSLCYDTVTPTFLTYKAAD